MFQDMAECVNRHFKVGCNVQSAYGGARKEGGIPTYLKARVVVEV